jgi:hypothetical protein
MRISRLLKTLCGLFILGHCVSPSLCSAQTNSDDVLMGLLSDQVKLLGPEGFRAAMKVIETYRQRGDDSTTVCNGRLTLTSATPITTADVTAATTIYFTPFNGAKIALYASSIWSLLSFAETSVSVPATTTTPFDIFAYNNSGTLALETLNWTNDTTRATALTTQNGVYVKSGSATRLYLGTGRTTSVSGQTEDSTARRFLWNQCNRVPRKLLATSNTDTWTYATSTWRAATNSTTTGAYRVEFVVGMQIEPVKLLVSASDIRGSVAGGSAMAIGVGINSTSVNSADYYGAWADKSASQLQGGAALARYRGFPGTGYSYAQWIEVTTGSTSFFTFNVSAGRVSAMVGEIWQ